MKFSSKQPHRAAYAIVTATPVGPAILLSSTPLVHFTTLADPGPDRPTFGCAEESFFSAKVVSRSPRTKPTASPQANSNKDDDAAAICPRPSVASRSLLHKARAPQVLARASVDRH